MKNIISFFEQWDIKTWSWIIWGLALVMSLLDDLIPSIEFAFIFTPFLAGWILLQAARLTGIISKTDLLSDLYRVVLFITLIFPIWSFLTIMIFGTDPIMNGLFGDKTPLEWSVFALKNEGIANSLFGKISVIPISWFIVYTFFKRFSDQSEKIDEVLKIMNDRKESSSEE